MAKRPREDKRKFARIEVEFPIRLLKLDQDKDENGIGRDISLEGIGVCAKKEFFKDGTLELQLKVPDGGKPILVKGKIIWSENMGGNTYRFGVSLENLDLSCLARAFKIKFE